MKSNRRIFVKNLVAGAAGLSKYILGTVVILFLSQSLCMAQNKVTFPLKVGAAKVDMTPKGEPTAPATGKYDHERAYARVIVHE